ncbi:NAD-dependent dehydratase [Terrimonas sp.]|uniref:NAD-dependent epimerase/dehydratase family protein n=1 Tax=Terrimonas sp. TaxID=1914338 RepID=UPI000D50DA97|nr:NAD-dependent epimerase/dehydratase family protein [Terrimonas sp.]PVD50339.1 NAD-dependent dehydratase [Terrimonas sp.]
MQTILGSGGDIGNLLAKELKQYTNKIRLVARNPQQVNGDDELYATNLLNAGETDAAIKGSEVAYLTVGLKYDLNVWQKQWPVIMQNVIEACIKHHCRLVFFDNVYMYDKTAIPGMTEQSPINPPSKKGKVRAQLVQMINKAMAEKGLKAIIARSADFYGPGAKNGILNILVINNYIKGKTANWQSNAHKIHSATYTPDAAKATAILGNTESAYNQVWHLPTTAERLTGKQIIELAAQIAKRKPSYMVLRPFLMAVIGLFSTQIKELVEMQYQNNQDYFFSSEKFNKAFRFTPTSFKDGIRQTMEFAKETLQ